MRTPAEIASSFAPRELLDGTTRFFLVGIGGAGMSALARLLCERGHDVLGSDSTDSPEVERLRTEGIEVRIGHAPLDQTENSVADGWLVPSPRAASAPVIEHGGHSSTALILSDAIPLATSPEVASARRLGIPIFRRSQLLGWLLKGHKLIAVTGTHGKTTTTGLTGAALIAAGLDPLVIVGAAIPDWGSPVFYGKGKWAVVEACEAYDSFHDLDPDIVVLTNLELDHVDFHGAWENLRASVTRFVAKLKRSPEGALVYCASDPGAIEIAKAVEGIRLVAYGPPLPFMGEGREEGGLPLPFMGQGRGEGPEGFRELPPLSLPGEHNRLNAAGALAAAKLAGVDPVLAMQGIAAFTGAERRLQLLREGAITIYDDYAHHPSEIVASLSALRAKAPGRRLIVVFQPHLYSRTAPLIPEFAEALSLADVVVLTDIYPAREDPMPGVSSARIAEYVSKPVRYVPSRRLLPRKVARMLVPGDVVVGMGAGNIAEFAPALLEEFDRPRVLNIAVLYGGDSAEREVSLHSGRAVHAALTRLGHRSTLMDMTDILLGKGDLAAFIGSARPDLAFLAVHGTHAEDGAIQGLLELLHIPYTGSGIQAGAIAMDKAMTKRILAAAGVRVPRGVLLTDTDVPVDVRPPLIVKPNAQGSTVGLSFVDQPGELCPALATAFAYDDSVLVEEWIRGVEISVPVLDDAPLPPVEIAPASGKYDFASKYLPGATEEIIPARIPEPARQEAQRLALTVHRLLGCAGATRTDMIVRNSESPDPEIFVLEINTLPGLTATSLLPNSAAAAGISFDQLCSRLVEDAMERHAAKT